MITFTEALALVISGGALAGLCILGSDVLRLAGRVRETERGNEREDSDERILHSENTQLCDRIDDLEKAVKFLAKALPHENLTSWREDDNSTRECISAPPSAPGATLVHALTPSAPPLPAWEDCCPACGLQSFVCICGGPAAFEDPCRICGSVVCLCGGGMYP